MGDEPEDGKPRTQKAIRFFDPAELDRKLDREAREKWDPKRPPPKPDPKPVGRRPYDDEKRLEEMARLIAGGKVRGRGGIRKAAEIVGKKDPDPDATATAERIRKKYAPRRDELEKLLSLRISGEQAKMDALVTALQEPHPFGAHYHANPYAEEFAAGTLDELQREIRARCQVDPQFARYMRRAGIRDQFVSLKCLQSVWASYSPKRRLRR